MGGFSRCHSACLKELQHVDRALTGGWVNPDRLAEQIRQANQPVPLQEPRASRSAIPLGR